MVQRGEELRLSLESSESFGVPGKFFGENFDRDVAPELGVGRTIDLTHSAFSDGLSDHVVRKLPTVFERHSATILG